MTAMRTRPDCGEVETLRRGWRRSAPSCIAVARRLPLRTRSGTSRSAVRAGTSCGANYEEARGAESRADFIHKVSVAAKKRARRVLADSSQRCMARSAHRRAPRGVELARGIDEAERSRRSAASARHRAANRLSSCPVSPVRRSPVPCLLSPVRSSDRLPVPFPADPSAGSAGAARTAGSRRG